MINKINVNLKKKTEDEDWAFRILAKLFNLLICLIPTMTNSWEEGTTFKKMELSTTLLSRERKQPLLLY